MRKFLTLQDSENVRGRGGEGEGEGDCGASLMLSVFICKRQNKHVSHIPSPLPSPPSPPLPSPSLPVQPIQIKSAIAVEGLKGYIYVEAYKQTHVKHVRAHPVPRPSLSG